jgi:hypothetical protein
MAHAAHAALLFLIIFATAAAARPLREAEEHPAVVRAPGLAAPAEQHRRLLDVVGASVLTMLVRGRAYMPRVRFASAPAALRASAPPPHRLPDPLWRPRAPPTHALCTQAADNARDAIQVATATGSPSAAMYATASGVTNARLATPGIGSFGYYGLTYPGRRF